MLNGSLIDARFRKWDNVVRLVIAALPSFFLIVEKALSLSSDSTNIYRISLKGNSYNTAAVH